MELLRFIFRFLYRIRYWLIIVPVIAAIVVAYLTRNPVQTYKVETSIYTGVISGQSITIDDAGAPSISTQNAMLENLVNLLTSSNTLKKVSLRLYAQVMMHGDLKKDNNYVKAATYKQILERTPKDVQALIDKNSEAKTVQNLMGYEKVDPQNYVYGLFNWEVPYFSYAALSQINVKRLGTSDILEVNYSADDPGIAYNTLKILNEEFTGQYENLRFGGTDDIIEFFRRELARVGDHLKLAEDSLTTYNIDKKVINYGEQTKQIAAMSRDFSLEQEQNLKDYYSAKASVDVLERRIGTNLELIKNNSEFINKLNNISLLTTRITEIESFDNDSIHLNKTPVQKYRGDLKNAKSDFVQFAESFYKQKYSKDGYANDDIIEQWLTELIKLEEAMAQKKVLEDWRKELDDQYSYYSPIGATLKRKEREINFTETTYLGFLKALNDAILRQKSMQMTTATIKILNPPIFPLIAEPNKRKAMIMAAFFASFIFVLGYFLLLELLDQTLRDHIRTERITGGKVVAAFPRASSAKGRVNDEACNQIASRYLSNTIVTYFAPTKVPQIINFISIEKHEGKSFIAKYLVEHWQSQGMSIKYVNWEKDMEANSRNFVLAKSIKDVIPYNNEDIILVEYPCLQDTFVPATLLQEATINICVMRANRIWKDTDRLLFKKLQSMTEHVPLYICLNYVEKTIVECFVGALPPYTKFKMMSYKFMQLGFTANEKIKFK